MELKQFCSEKCPRYNNGVRTPCLPGVGPIPARVMIVGESPGQKEDEVGVPFVGASGNLIDDCLRAAGLDRSQIYITNAVKCGTPGENAPPSKKEIKICKQYLIEEIKEVKPEIIVTLGAKALEAVLNRTGIATINNNIFTSEEFNVKVLPIYHPAYGLRNPGVIPAIKKGFELLAKELSGKGQDTEETKVFTAKNEEDINKILEKLEGVKKFSFDFETSSLRYLEAKILSIAFSWKAGTATVIPWALHTKETLKRLNNILANKNIIKIAQNIKFEMHICKANNLELNPPYEDTMLIHHLLDENSKHGLDVLTLRFTKLGEYWKEIDLFIEKYCKDNKLEKDKFTYNLIPEKILLPYNGKDADATLQAFSTLYPRLEQQKLSNLYYNYVIPYLSVIVEMEHLGIACDRDQLKNLIEEYTKKKEEFEVKVYENSEVLEYEKYRKEHAKEAIRSKFEDSKILKSRYADFDTYAEQAIKEKDYKFNMSSPKQLGELLFEIPKRAPIKVTDKGAISVDESVLEELDKAGVGVAQLLLDYRKLVKYLSTYLISTYEKSAFDGRVHGEFLQTGTVTGRLASRNPNLQNLPRDAKDFKKCFISDPGFTFVKADLAQAEFRCWASYSGDEDLIADIHSGLDIHKRTASEVFGAPIEEITKDDPRRTAAKAATFGILFGRGAAAIASQYNISYEQAEDIKNIFFSRYPKAKMWITSQKYFVKSHGYVRGYLGRYRRLPEIDSNEPGVAAEAERQAVNSPIQGLSTDLNNHYMRMSIIRAREEGIECYPVATVHDANFIMVKDDKVTDMIRIMEEVVKTEFTELKCKMQLDFEVGKTFGTFASVKD